jgi:hypothetical protein
MLSAVEASKRHDRRQRIRLLVRCSDRAGDEGWQAGRGVLPLSLTLSPRGRGDLILISLPALVACCLLLVA